MGILSKYAGNMSTQLLSNWFFCAITATVIYGMINFLYKIAANIGLSSSQLLNRSAITASLTALILALATGSSFANIEMILLFALINSSFFALGALCKLNALKLAPTSHVFPIIRMNSIITILLAVLFLKERPELSQWMGITLAILMAYVIKQDMGSESGKTNLIDLKKGITLATVTAISSGISVFTGKLASTRVPKLSYIFISYAFVFIYTHIISTRYKKETRAKADYRVNLFGIAIGLLNIFGYYLVLQAFSTGPLTLVQGISSTSMIIPILLSVFFLKEGFNVRKGIIIVMALAAVMLIKMKF